MSFRTYTFTCDEALFHMWNIVGMTQTVYYDLHVLKKWWMKNHGCAWWMTNDL